MTASSMTAVILHAPPSLGAAHPSLPWSPTITTCCEMKEQVTESLVGVLANCTALALLNLRHNQFGDDRAGSRSGGAVPCAGSPQSQVENDIGHTGADDIGHAGAGAGAGRFPTVLANCQTLLHLDFR